MVSASAESGGHRPALHLLWGAFGVQIAGRLLDLWWHSSHDEFESGRDQLTAHWLVWLGTVLMLMVAIRALRSEVPAPWRLSYHVVLWSNLLYVAVAVAHFVQHLNRMEVDWAHAGLAVTNLASAAGVAMMTIAWRRSTQARAG